MALLAAMPQSDPPSITGWDLPDLPGNGKVPRSDSLKAGLAFLMRAIVALVALIAAALPSAKTRVWSGLSVSMVRVDGAENSFWNCLYSFRPRCAASEPSVPFQLEPCFAAMSPPASHTNCTPVCQ